MDIEMSSCKVMSTQSPFELHLSFPGPDRHFYAPTIVHAVSLEFKKEERSKSMNLEDGSKVLIHLWQRLARASALAVLVDCRLSVSGL
jgi:hypothetical protein